MCAEENIFRVNIIPFEQYFQGQRPLTTGYLWYICPKSASLPRHLAVAPIQKKFKKKIQQRLSRENTFLGQCDQRTTYVNYTIKTARSQQCLVNQIHTICGSNDQNPCSVLNSIHLVQHGRQNTFLNTVAARA